MLKDGKGIAIVLSRDMEPPGGRRGRDERPSPSDSGGGQEGDDQDGGMAEESAAGDVLKAIKSGDTKALASALSDFYDICSSEE